jgi:hypothetical protein
VPPEAFARVGSLPVLPAALWARTAAWAAALADAGCPDDARYTDADASRTRGKPHGVVWWSPTFRGRGMMPRSPKTPRPQHDIGISCRLVLKDLLAEHDSRFSSAATWISVRLNRR